MARTGKIASLPEPLRTAANQRKLNGARGREVIAWLNAQPEVEARLRERWGEDWRINDQNWSDWYRGGYQDWLTDRKKLEHTRELSAYAAKFVEADAGNITSGAAAIAAGTYLQVLEAMDAETVEEKLEILKAIVPDLARLRAGDQNEQALKQAQEKIAQKDRELALAIEKYQRETLELFLRWHEDQRARELAQSSLSNEEKISRLGQLMFGDAFLALKQAAP